MSEPFFHLLGPGTQPSDKSFSMNPLPITCQVNDDPCMATLEHYTHSVAVMVMLDQLITRLTLCIPPLGEVLAWDLTTLQSEDIQFLNALLGEGEVSMHILHADGSESEIQEAIFCGLWWVRRLRDGKVLTERLEVGRVPLPLWQAVNGDTLPEDSLLPPPIDGLMNGLALAHELLSHVRNPSGQVHTINITQLPLNEVDRLFLASLCGKGRIHIRTFGYGESRIESTGLRYVWHLRCLNTLKGTLFESYEVCMLPELILAAPEDLIDSAQRLSDVYRWLEENTDV